MVALNPARREVTLDIQVVNQDGADVVAARAIGYLPAAEWGIPKRQRLPELDG